MQQSQQFSLQTIKLTNTSVYRYITSLETGSQPVTDIFHFVVYDGDNNRLDNQMCTITITSTPRQPPVVTVRSGIKVLTHLDTAFKRILSDIKYHTNTKTHTGPVLKSC